MECAFNPANNDFNRDDEIDIPEFWKNTPQHSRPGKDSKHLPTHSAKTLEDGTPIIGLSIIPNYTKLERNPSTNVSVRALHKIYNAAAA